MTAPLIGAHIDLRDFPYMPLDVVRLRDSDLAAIASGDGFRAAVMLWCAAWHQLPAASLPKDDRLLASLAGFGRDVEAWKAVKEDALRNFVECDDGRLYHPTIAEKAREAWEAKVSRRQRTEAARLAKLSRSTSAVCDDEHPVSVAVSVTEPVTSSKGREGKGEESKNTEIQETSLDGLVASTAAPRKAKRAKARTQISEDAQPDEKDRQIADEHGLSAELFRSEWRKFRSCHLAKGSQFANWHEAWRNWCEKIPEFQSHQARAGPQKPSPENPWLNAIEDICDERDRRLDIGGLEGVKAISYDG